MGRSHLQSCKNASEFLSECPATAKSACNTTEFEANVIKIANDCKEVNCSMSDECKQVAVFKGSDCIDSDFDALSAL